MAVVDATTAMIEQQYAPPPPPPINSRSTTTHDASANPARDRPAAENNIAQLNRR